MKQQKEKVELKTPQQVWDFYCEVGNFEKTEVGDDASDWITQLMPNFSEEDFMAVIRHSAGSPAYAVFDENYFRTVLKTIKLEKEIEDMKSVDRQSANSLDLLTRTVASVMTEEVKKVTMDNLQEDFKNWVQANYGPTYKVPTIYTSPTGKKIEGAINAAFDDVAMWVACDEPVMLTGPAGSGKNKLVQQIGTYFDMPVLIIDSIQDASELQGYKTIDGSFAQTPFIVFARYCMEQDKQGIVMFDEIDNSDASAMVTINDAIASREITIADNTHLDLKNIRFMACGNTWGTGATDEYVGRNQLDASTLDRFSVVEVGYDGAVEKSICPDEEIVKFVDNFRWAAGVCGIKHIVSYRGLTKIVKAFNYCKDKLDNSMKKRILKQCLTKNLTAEDLRMITNRMKTGNEYYSIIQEMSEEQ